MSDGGTSSGGAGSSPGGEGGWGRFATPAPADVLDASPPYLPSPAVGGWQPRPVWQLALAPIGALVAAAVVGAVAGFVVFTLAGGGRSDSSGGEGWDVLGHVLIGMGAGLLVGGITYVVLLSVAAGRLIPPGRRAAAVVVAVLVSPALLVVGAVVTGIGSHPALLSRALLQLAWLVAAPAVFVLFGRGLHETRPGPAGPQRQRVTASVVALSVLAGLLGLALTAGAVGSVSHRAEESKAVSRLPLVLFTRSGSTGYWDTPDVPGWRRDVLTTTYVHPVSSVAGIGEPGTSEAFLKYVTPQGTSFVTMHESLGECSPQVVRGFSCEVIQTGGGRETRRYRHLTASLSGDLLAQEYLARVDADGTAVSVSLDPLAYSAQGPAIRAAQEADAVRVLQSTVRVGRAQFERTAHTQLRTVG